MTKALDKLVKKSITPANKVKGMTQLAVETTITILLKMKVLQRQEMTLKL
jgi:hypothetical protein